MKNINDFSDERNKSWCIHCGQYIASVDVNRDHVPTKSLLRKPYPAELPIIPVCKKCNEDYSLDEEYFSTFLNCAISGSTDPDDQKTNQFKNALETKTKLRQRIESSRRQYGTMGGALRTYWKPEQKRIDRVLLKNARGHVYFEYGEPLLKEPDYIWSAPLEYLSPSAISRFQNIDLEISLPEVGSRMLTRMITGADMQEGWIIVQADVYRYAVLQQGTMLVRMMLAEYLAAEVFWA